MNLRMTYPRLGKEMDVVGAQSHYIGYLICILLSIAFPLWPQISYLKFIVRENSVTQLRKIWPLCIQMYKHLS